MAKGTGLGDNFYVGGADLSGNVNALKKISCPLDTLNMTAINQFAYERADGKHDGAMSFTTLFDPATGFEHKTLSTLPTTDVLMTYVNAAALGSDAASMICKQVNYDGTRDDKGNFTFDVDGIANAFGLEWGNLLTPAVRADTTATNGTGFDLVDASTSFGWQAYLHVFSFTGTSCTVTIKDATTLGGTYTALTSGAFVAATAAGFQRLVSPSSTSTVREFVRVDTSGTFSQCSFAVVFCRNRNHVAVF